MILLLVRHAKSSWKNPHLRDFDRPLNKRGKKDAPFMADHLLGRAKKPDYLVSSPANRALTTAKIFAETFGFKKSNIVENKNLYEASSTELLFEINKLPAEAKTVMLFAHNPGLTNLSNFLTSVYIENIPTCGIVAIEFPFEKWTEIRKESGKLLFFDFPKKFKGN